MENLKKICGRRAEVTADGPPLGNEEVYILIIDDPDFFPEDAELADAICPVKYMNAASRRTDRVRLTTALPSPRARAL